MISKVELYREVLAIEPHSRVFFPLAKILSETNALDEAITVLKRGVTFHPDHLEAKFLLVELLSRQGKENDASENFASVADVLSQYPSVWQLWAKKTALQSKDSSLAMAFLASYFQGKSLTWSEIFEKGLASVFSENSQSTPAQQPVEPAPQNVVQPEESSQRSPETPSVAQKTPEFELNNDNFSSVTEEKSEEIQSIIPEEKHLVETVAEAAGPAKEMPIVVEPIPKPSVASAPVAQTPVASAPEPLPLRGMEEVMRLTGASSSFSDPASNEAEDDYDDDDDVGIDEAYESMNSLVADPSAGHGIRTLTMADLLAKHGDLTGAIDIYQELLEKMPAGNAHNALLVKLDDLRRRAGIAVPSDILMEQQQMEPPSGHSEHTAKKELSFEEIVEAQNADNPAPSTKPKILGVLESLADRLEARNEV